MEGPENQKWLPLYGLSERNFPYVPYTGLEIATGNQYSLITSYVLGIVLGKLTKNVVQGVHDVNNTTFLPIKKINLRLNHVSKSQSKKMAEPG